MYNKDMPELILASASPQRKTLLAGLGVSFSVIPSGVDESACAEADPGRRALLLSTLKARDVAGKNPEAFVIGCDTLVVAPDGTLLEKPRNENDARNMLQLQSGGVSMVHSGLTVIHKADEWAAVSTSSVHFAALSPQTVDWWMELGQWKDRSGSFQIDGPGQLLIKHIEGDWTGIVGLPVYLLGELLRKAKYPVHDNQ